jgi:proton-coupled amino acid transporter
MLKLVGVKQFCRRVLGADSVVSFGDVGEQAYGAPGRAAVNLLVVLTQAGFCSGYVLFVAQSMVGLVPELTFRQWIGVTLPVFTLLAWIRSIKRLAPVSLAGLACLAVATVTCMIHSFQVIARNRRAHTPADTVLVNPPQLLVFFGMCVSSYEGIGLALPIEASLDNPKRYPLVLTATLSLVSVLYVFVAVVGYLAYGAGVNSILIADLPDGTFVTVVKAFLIAAIVLTYPLMLAPVVEMTEKSRWCTAWLATGAETLKKNLIRFVLVGLTVAVAAGIPNFGLMRGLVGALGGASLMFVCPSVFRLKICADTLSKTERYTDIFMAIFGIAAAIASTVVTAIAIAKSE